MVQVNTKPTKPIDGQKTGTSGLRKKTKVFTGENYLANWVQSLFNVIQGEIDGQQLGLGGDGRYFNKEAAQIIIKLAAGNGFGRVVVGQHGYMATPAMSALIRRRKLYGGLIMSASHNPGGIDQDWGIKFNYTSGEPAPEKITDQIFTQTKVIQELAFGDVPDIDLSKLGVQTFGEFQVEVIDPVQDYLQTLKEVFDFSAIKKLFARNDFTFVYDALHAITGAYANRIFVDELGANKSQLKNCIPLEDFGKGHPDPNLTYAEELVKIMYGKDAPILGAASDGDGDRNMILGDHFFVNPSDSVAMIAHNSKCIPYYKNGLKGVARSMPTGQALDRVAAAMKIEFNEVPTGWKYFGNLMDDDQCSICGEESFGTGGDHIREKDGIWAVLAWLSILAYKNKNTPEGKLIGVKEIAFEFWNQYGRNFFSRYDYEGVDSDGANKMIDYLRRLLTAYCPGTNVGNYVIRLADEFSYVDPVDGSVASHQGIRFIFEDSSRVIFRLSGTGSAGATVRMYIEQYTNDPSKYGLDAQEVLQTIIKDAAEMSHLQHFIKRDKPSVIT